MKGSIADLELPKHVENHLRYEGVRTIRALLTKTPFGLLAWRGFGLSSLKAVRISLESRGLSLKDDPGLQAIWHWDHHRLRGKLPATHSR